MHYPCARMGAQGCFRYTGPSVASAARPRFPGFARPARTR
ncbi:hypothetical protein Y027_5700 [Burkholderia pseudomallei TSV5]|nr:hypothetical protein DO72_5191 [Burkholderia pseudomallei]KGX49600.1 hypothetical protein Y027_5700 [Burkholderia pseudomallei TSV5]